MIMMVTKLKLITIVSDERLAQNGIHANGVNGHSLDPAVWFVLIFICLNVIIKNSICILDSSVWFVLILKRSSPLLQGVAIVTLRSVFSLVSPDHHHPLPHHHHHHHHRFKVEQWRPKDQLRCRRNRGGLGSHQRWHCQSNDDDETTT